MAIALDATSSGQGTVGTTITFAHTCAANALLVVFVGSQDGVGAPTVTYNSVAMTQIASTNTNMSCYAFILLNPSSGANNVVVTKDSGTDYAASAISFTGAGGYDATNTSNAASGTSGSVTVNTNRTTGFVVAAQSLANNGSATYTGSGTEFVDRTNGGSDSFQSSYEAYAGSANITSSWTWGSNGKNCRVGVEIYQTGGTSGFLMFM